MGLIILFLTNCDLRPVCHLKLLVTAFYGRNKKGLVLVNMTTYLFVPSETSFFFFSLFKRFRCTNW